jgi:two-component system, OmpR family, alkaline phosphatase synthesis response regulator PhoP
MATILIAEDDELLARQMANTLRQAGHVPMLARDARAALRAARERPDGILLDLELPDLSVEDVLAQLERSSGRAHIPVLIVTGKREAVVHLKEAGRVAEVLRKPVSGVHLRESVDTLLGTQLPPDAQVLRLDRSRQRQLILHLIAHGPDPLALQISRRLCADRLQGRQPGDGGTLTWQEIADWGQREGLMDAEQTRLLGRMPASAASDTREGVSGEG